MRTVYIEAIIINEANYEQLLKVTDKAFVVSYGFEGLAVNFCNAPACDPYIECQSENKADVERYRKIMMAYIKKFKNLKVQID